MSEHENETHKENGTAAVDEYFGIDLGTTYSCIARIGRFGRAEIIANLDGDRTTPSVVYFFSDTDNVVGKAAKQEVAIDPANGVQLVKRQMGDEDWRFRPHGAEFSAPVVASQILGYLKESVERTTGSEVRGVVITVPAYFGDTERQATKLAGEYAGLDVLGIINEPTAAAFFHGLEDEEETEKTILVYDLGGGTFDVTVMTVSAEELTVLSTGGDKLLGGADWDNALVDVMLAKFAESHPEVPDMSFDPTVRAKLALLAEEVKWALTQVERRGVSVVIEGVAERVEVTGDEFEAATRHLLERTLEKTRDTILAARERGATTIDRILLVGGASKMPAVTERLREEFGVEPELRDPDLAVAMGAALIAAREGLLRELVGQEVPIDGAARQTAAPTPEVLAEAKEKAAEYGLPAAVADEMFKPFKNVCSQGFGIVAEDETGELRVHFLVHRNDRLPTVVEHTYGTVVDNQPSVEIRVMEQGTDQESTRLEDNKDVAGGTGLFEGIPAGHPRHTPVNVRFEMGDDGGITVTGTHPGFPGTMTVTAQTGSLLSPERVKEEKALANALQRTA